MCRCDLPACPLDGSTPPRRLAEVGALGEHAGSKVTLLGKLGGVVLASVEDPDSVATSHPARVRERAPTRRAPRIVLPYVFERARGGVEVDGSILGQQRALHGERVKGWRALFSAMIEVGKPCAVSISPRAADGDALREPEATLTGGANRRPIFALAGVRLNHARCWMLAVRPGHPGRCVYRISRWRHDHRTVTGGTGDKS